MNPLSLKGTVAYVVHFHHTCCHLINGQYGAVTSMLVFRLPVTLENMLANLHVCQDSQVLSWNIPGGPEFTQVSIRFSPGNSSGDMNKVKIQANASFPS